MKSISVDMPDRLHERLERFVKGGWATDPQEILVDAVRRFLDAHEPAEMERFIMEDVEWGLHGKE